MPSKPHVTRDVEYSLKWPSNTPPAQFEPFPLNVILEKRGEQAQYSFEELGQDASRREARGICAVGITETNSNVFPSRILARFPDFRGLPDKAAKTRYIEAFNEEVSTELELLGNIDDDTVIARPLEGLTKLPQLTLQDMYAKVNILLCPMPEGTTLREQRSGKGRITISQWCAFSEDLIHVVHKLHLKGLRHGYICPDTIIVGESLRNPRLVHLEWDTPDPTLWLKSDPTIPRLCWRRPYDSPDKICYPRGPFDTSDVNDPFAPGDIFSLGLTLLFLAKTNYETNRDRETLHPFARESRWDKLPWNLINEPFLKSNETVKEEVRCDIRKAFSNDVREEALIAATEIVFACLRTSAHRFYNTRAIIEVLDRFRPSIFAGTNPQVERRRSPAATNLEDLANQLINSLELNDPIVTDLFRVEIKECLYPAMDSSNKRFTVGRSRDDIVDALSDMLLRAGKNWQCSLLLTPAFWFEENCGPDGRVASAFKIAMHRGCKVKMMLNLKEHRTNVPAVTHVMNHMRTWVNTFEKQLTFRWKPLSADGFRDFLRKKESFVALRPSATSPWTRAIPDFASEAGPIIALRIFPGVKDWEPVSKLAKEIDARHGEVFTINQYTHR